MSETKNNTTNSTDRPVEQTKQTEKKPDKTEHDVGVVKQISPSESDYIFWTG